VIALILEYLWIPFIKAPKLSLKRRPSKINAKFQIVVPRSESDVNFTIFIRLIPAGIVINTRNTGIKRQSCEVHITFTSWYNDLELRINFTRSPIK
jgi:hypothetical protein